MSNLFLFLQLVSTFFINCLLVRPNRSCYPLGLQMRAILTGRFVRCGQRVRIRLAPAHWEDVHGFHVNDELRSGSLQACSEQVERRQVQRGCRDRDAGEERCTQSSPEAEEPFSEGRTQAGPRRVRMRQLYHSRKVRGSRRVGLGIRT